MLCTYGAMSTYYTFVEKNKRSGCLLLFCFLKNAVLALQILCMMDMWLYRRKLAYAWTDRWASSAFLCSFVLMSLFLEHTDYAGMRSLVLARDDGSLVLCFLWMYIFFRQKNKRDTLIYGCSNKWICHTFHNQCNGI